MRKARLRVGLRRAQKTPAIRMVDIARGPDGKGKDKPMEPCLVAGGRIVAMAEGTSVILGKLATETITLAGAHVSGRHVRIDCHQGDLCVQDLGSTNGTWRRGHRLDRGPLGYGDCLMLGRTPVLVGRLRRLGQLGRRRVSVRWQGIIAADPLSLRTLETVGRYSASAAPVWIRGASGTGKERIAHALHAASPRSDGSFVSINCAALPVSLAEAELFGCERGAFTGAVRRPGAFLRADNGTLFLDEVGDLPLAIQAKLLRVLETGEVQPVGGDGTRQVSARVICATWRDLEADAKEGRFRFDLLHRLAVLRVTVPDLAMRPRDIPPLIHEFLEEFGAMGLQPDRATWYRLIGRGWPGNVRELRNITRRAALAGTWSEIGMGVVGDDSSRLMNGSNNIVTPRQRRVLARRAVRGASGNRARAARSLGVSRSTLYRWLDPTG